MNRTIIRSWELNRGRVPFCNFRSHFFGKVETLGMAKMREGERSKGWGKRKEPGIDQGEFQG